MTDSAFVARDRELARLGEFLDRAMDKHGQVALVAGEPGSGKTALLLEFTRRAQAKYNDLIVAVGNCNAQIGVGEPYLPFLEVLGLLTGDLEAKLEQGIITVENASRIKKILAKSGLILLDVAPDLIELVPVAGQVASKLLAPVSEAMVKQTGLETKLEAIAQRKPELLKLTENTVDQEHIFEQCTNFLRRMSAEHPLLIVLDDLQWADVSSLNLLFHISRRIEGSPILIVGSFRPDEVAFGRDGQRHPMEKVEAELKRLYGDITIDLTSGDNSDGPDLVNALVDAQPNRIGFEFRQSLCQHTACNPLFVLELLREMQDRGDIVHDDDGRWIVPRAVDWQALPARIEGVIQERIDRLSSDLRETLTVSSVQGELFTAEVVAKMREASDRDLVRQLSSELSKRHRLVEAAGVERLGNRRLSQYHFRHNLIQRYIYNTLDEVELAYLHEDVGLILEELYASQLEAVVGRLAWHFTEAGLEDKAAQYLRLAGEQAARRHAHDEALQHLNQALELTPDDDVSTRFQILQTRELVHSWRGQREAQTADLAQLSDLARLLAGHQANAHVSLRLANYHRLTGDYAKALSHAQLAVSEAEQAGERSLEARGYAMWGKILWRTGNYDEVPEWLELALDLAQAVEDQRLTAEITYDLGLNHFSQDRYPEAERLFQQALTIHQSLDDRRGEIFCQMMIGTLHTARGEYDAAIRYLDEALALCRSVGWRSREAMMLANLGSTHLELGSYDTARSYHQQALTVSSEVGDREGVAISLDTLGLIASLLGDYPLALDYLQQALQVQSEIGYRRGRGYALTHLGHALLNSDDLAGAQQAFTDALAIRRELDPNSGTAMDDVAGLALVSLRLGRPGEALARAEEVLDWIAANGPERLEYPVHAFLLCYRVLMALGSTDPTLQARAQDVLMEGYVLLESRAEAIENAELRRSYLEDVPFHRELRAAWATT